MTDAIKQAIEYIDSVPDDRGNAGHIDRDQLIAALRAQPDHIGDANKMVDHSELVKLAREVAEWHLEDGDECGVTARALVKEIDALEGK